MMENEAFFSKEDFLNMQNQLIEEKSKVCELSERCKNYEKELANLKKNEKTHKIRALSKYLSRGNDEQERENEILKQRMLIQEEEFKLQTDILKKELEKLTVLNIPKCSSNVRDVCMQTTGTVDFCNGDDVGDTPCISDEYKEQIESLKSEIAEFKLQVTQQHTEIDMLNDELGRCRKAMLEGSLQEDKAAQHCKNLMGETSSYINEMLFRECEKMNEVVAQFDKLDERVESFMKLLIAAKSKIRTITEQTKSMKEAASDVKLEALSAKKKSASVVKDLQRQLRNEKRRNDLLQEKLQKWVPNQPDDIDSILGKLSTDDSKEDLRSLSSISGIGSCSEQIIGPRNISTCSLLEQSSLTQSSDVDGFDQINRLQKESDYLREKVRYLESANSAMASDLIDKSSLIQAYFLRDGNSVPPRFRSNSKVNSLFRTFSVDDPIVRNLQVVLEETLTKNLHMQKNIETMSKEIEKLRSQLGGGAVHYG